MDKAKDLVPDHREGMETDTESSAEFSSTNEATEFFRKVKERLLSVNQWHQYAGAATADFQLTDNSGKEVQRKAQKGDHFKINIPGPGIQTGDGYDWVQIEAIEETDEALTIRVRPATNPRNDHNDVAHFFSDEATSSFMVRREGNTVIAGVYGRNEKPNTSTEKLTDNLRNAAVATGAISGFSKLQWKSLVNGLIQIS